MSAPEALNLTEPVVVLDTFVTGMAPVHVIGDNVRLTLVTEQRGFDGRVEHAICSKLVGSRSDMLQIAAAIVRGCNQGAEKITDAFLTFLEAPPERH